MVGNPDHCSSYYVRYLPDSPHVNLTGDFGPHLAPSSMGEDLSLSSLGAEFESLWGHVEENPCWCCGQECMFCEPGQTETEEDHARWCVEPLHWCSECKYSGCENCK